MKPTVAFEFYRKKPYFSVFSYRCAIEAMLSPADFGTRQAA